MRVQLLAGCIAAFLFAALAFVIALFFGTFGLVPVGLGFVLAHALVLGLPIFLIFWWKRWINAISCASAGFIVAAISGVVPNWPWTAAMQAMRTNTSVRGVPTVIDGTPTMAGWLDFAGVLVFLGAFGAFAGFIFWLILSLCGALAPTDNEPDPSRRASYWGAGAGRAISLAVAAVLLTGAVLAFPSANVGRIIADITTDRTCHNVLRDRDRISSKVGMYLQIVSDDIPKLTRAIEDFAATHALSFRNSSVPTALFLSLCNDRGVTIQLQLFVAISVFELQPGSGWERTTKDLITALETLWPGKLGFNVPGGKFVPRPKELQ